MAYLLSDHLLAELYKEVWHTCVVRGQRIVSAAYPLFHARCSNSPPLIFTLDEFRREFPEEGDYVEFKQGLSEARVAEAVCAFSNADGGVVLLGVAPTGRPVGSNTSGEFRARLHRVVTAVHNPGRYELEAVAVDGKTVLALSIDRRHEGFAQLPDGRVLVRRGAQNAALIGSQLSDFVSRRALVRVETQPTATALSDAEPSLRQSLVHAWRWRADDEIEGHLISKGDRKSVV